MVEIEKHGLYLTLSKGTGIGTVCVCPSTGRKIAKGVIYSTKSILLGMVASWS